ncbi:hypothetical protein TWF481_002879 [Arthrobotrys musiformis]|uniref:Retrotransposon Copia-like N-terminal domain-containing protein n=1 Tax=Arthrobotrys musiformis TaxID=47236 RepID=A0AAV9VRM5_9PEZI
MADASGEPSTSTSQPPQLRAYQPKQIILKQDNYLQWRILVKRNIKRLGWLHYTQVVGTKHNKEEKAKLSPTELKAFETEWAIRLDCSTYILENVESSLWTRFHSMEEDPYNMWADIKNIWQAQNEEGKRRYEMQLDNLLMMEETIDEYITRAVDLKSKLMAAGGTIDNSRFILNVLRGLPSKYHSIRENIDYDLTKDPKLSINTVQHA